MQNTDGKNNKKIRKNTGKSDKAGSLELTNRPAAGNPDIISCSENGDIPAVRKRGRPKGSGKPGTRPDSSVQNSLPDAIKSNVLRHNLQLYNLDRVKDRDDPIEIANRLKTYFELCAQNNVMPTIAGMAFSLGINRRTLWDWISDKRGTIKNPDVVDILKNAYSFIESEYEDMLTNGKIIPVSAFFLMKNNFGYQDTSNLVVSNGNSDSMQISDITDRAGLLNE